jgi:hypothetical protein
MIVKLVRMGEVISFTIAAIGTALLAFGFTRMNVVFLLLGMVGVLTGGGIAICLYVLRLSLRKTQPKTSKVSL